ncbi:AKT-interacting protein [Eurytemora carolleeae]|uniref:AKT-interacting protein n=1 Tax=Eurytemora carolleeae TaxID=1294199 RepID=UPI000C77B08F|nr:AKT-interacting protein [Eurytemora carolleeae]|eukprot:XP_023327829.1 AKT-interacting protein-like [Eurytemora affinis]
MHNHGGKVLPEVPDLDTQLALSAKMIDKKTSTPKGSHSYGSYFLEYSLMAEFQLLQQQRLPGIYCLPAHSSPLTWWGVLFIRQGPYQGGVFRFQIHLPENYPDGDCPKVVFDGPVYHPHIDPVTHQLNVKQGFHKWKRNVNHIWQLLLYTRRVFYKVEVPNPDLAKNKDAALLWEQDVEKFQTEAQDCVRRWEQDLYSHDNPDPHFIRFSKFDPAVHEGALQDLKSGGAGGEGSVGEGEYRNRKSYMTTGSLTIFSDMPEVKTSGPSSLPK